MQSVSSVEAKELGLDQSEPFTQDEKGHNNDSLPVESLSQAQADVIHMSSDRVKQNMPHSIHTKQKSQQTLHSEAAEERTENKLTHNDNSMLVECHNNTCKPDASGSGSASKLQVANETKVEIKYASTLAVQHMGVNEEQGKGSTSFFRSKENQSITKSLKYALTTVIWSFYHSSVLNIIPIFITSCLFGCTWFFEVNYDNMMIQYLTSTIFLLIVMYALIASIFMHIFGRSRVFGLVCKLTVPLCSVNILMFVIRAIYHLSLISYINYGVFLFHIYILLKMIPLNKDKHVNSSGDLVTRYDVLCSDGTPMIVCKGYIAYMIPYLITSAYIVPLIMDLNFIYKVIGRVIIVPFLFYLSDSYMNNLIMNKSKELMKYRMVAGNIMTFIPLPILRLMITNSGSTENTILLATFSSVLDVVLRLSYLPRKVYYVRLSDYFEKKWLTCFTNKKVHNFSGMEPSGAQPSTGDSLKDDVGNVEIENIEFSAKGLRELFQKLNQADSMSQLVADFHSKRTSFNSMGEIQLTIYYPLNLFLFSCIKRYISFETFSSVDEMFMSICIQLPIEFLNQILSITLEYYLYGIELPVKKSWKFYVNPQALSHFTLVILSSFYLSVSAYQLNTEDWPKS